MKKKFILIVFLGILVIFLSGITYSLFNSSATLVSTNQGIASFIFETKNLEHIDLNLNGLIPGDKKEYLFSVTNTNENDIISDVVIQYQLNIKTYHFIPLTIELYKMDGEKETFIKECNETSARNSDKELICDMPVAILTNSETQTDNYKLKIEFPETYNDISYSNLVDFINIEIESWQKI